MQNNQKYENGEKYENLKLKRIGLPKLKISACPSYGGITLDED